MNWIQVWGCIELVAGMERKTFAWQSEGGCLRDITMIKDDGGGEKEVTKMVLGGKQWGVSKSRKNREIKQCLF